MKKFLSVLGLVVCLFVFAQVDAALVGQWPMNENSGSVVNDTSGNGLTGTISGALWTTGISGSALDFDGIDDYVSIPSPAVIDLSSNQVTIEAWVIISGTGVTDTYLNNIVTIQDGWDYYQFSIRLSGAPPYGPPYRFSVQVDTEEPVTGNDSYVETFTAAPVSLDTWYYLACTYDGSVLRLYVNGTLAASITNTTPTYLLRYDFKNMRIGSALGTRFFNGTIDEVAIYNTALDPTEIIEHYMLGLGWVPAEDVVELEERIEELEGELEACLEGLGAQTFYLPPGIVRAQGSLSKNPNAVKVQGKIVP